MEGVDRKFIELVRKHTRNEHFGEDDFDEDFKNVGLDSLASINLLLDIEEAYQLNIPDEYLTNEFFRNARTLWNLVSQLMEKSERE